MERSGVSAAPCRSARSRCSRRWSALEGYRRRRFLGVQAISADRAGLERPDLQQKALGREHYWSARPELQSSRSTGAKTSTSGDRPLPVRRWWSTTRTRRSPNQNAVLSGLRRDDLFTVVLEQFQNDTADYADILLPATTFLEHTDLYLAYGHYYLQLARPARGARRGQIEC